jgi:LuxR family quorum-sensing system transcriptional regulator CciR
VRLITQDLVGFLECFRSAETFNELHELLEIVTKALGFAQFAMGHHVDLSDAPNDAIRMTTYNADWVAHVVERGYFYDDPIHLASTRTASGFEWRDVGDFIRLKPRHKQILTEAAGFGLVAGYTVPGEYHGTCSFATDSPDSWSDDAIPVAQICGTFAFEAARRILRSSTGMEHREVPDLTPRQMDALVLVGRGKTDREIGELLGVSRATAHEHVESVRRAYGNAQRAYLIVRALFDGQVAFADLLWR